jgi:hypothetical protein
LLVPFPDDHPEKCWNFLNEREVAWVLARVQQDRGDAIAEPFNLLKFLKPALDLKIWGFAIMFMCNTTQSYALVSAFLSKACSLSQGVSWGMLEGLRDCWYARCRNRG